jgi:gentisate 1,2-dioxygenase
MFFEPLEEDEEHEAFAKAPPTKDSPFVFTMADTRKRLDAAEQTPEGPFGTCIELGGPALDTTALYMMRLKPGLRTSPYRTTANNIFAVVHGTGVTTVDGERFAWKRGDVIAVPAWRPHFHEASDDALLFRVTDEPVLAKLGFQRVEEQAGAAE